MYGRNGNRIKIGDNYMGNEEKARKLTRDEKFAVQQMGRFWKDWMYLKESASEDYIIAVNRHHPTQTKRFRKIT